MENEKTETKTLLSQDVVDLLLKSPDASLDSSMFPLIRKWSNPPRAVEILEVLDRCIFSGLASGFIVTLLRCGYEVACDTEGTTHDDVVKLAEWRNRP